EDGIRAFHVTGVQTCALPICDLVNEPLEFLVSPDRLLIGRPDDTGGISGVPAALRAVQLARDRSFATSSVPDHEHIGAPLEVKRSEERRVGKECRRRCGLPTS